MCDKQNLLAEGLSFLPELPDRRGMLLLDNALNIIHFPKQEKGLFHKLRILRGAYPKDKRVHIPRLRPATELVYLVLPLAIRQNVADTEVDLQVHIPGVNADCDSPAIHEVGLLELVLVALVGVDDALLLLEEELEPLDDG